VDIFRHLHPGQPRHYTWWSYRTRAWERNVGWRIDYFLISKPLLSRVKDCTILKNVLGSDHAPILLEIDGALSS
jgi:exodeoxyribonuclease-3